MNNERTNSIDILRFVFAFMVVYIHSYTGTEQSAIISRMAVPGFFMISGFCIEYIVKKGWGGGYNDICNEWQES